MAATRTRALLAAGALAIVAAPRVDAAVLPEDRADASYHYYEGGGVTVDGPALLVRKGFAEKLSLTGSYYADSVSSASIDVVTTASPYADKRDEYGLALDYLHRDSLFNLSVSQSEESDYEADTLSLGVAHELFSGMSTFSLGYTRGADVVRRVDTDFRADIDRHQFRLGWSQVVTKRLLVNVDFEAVTDQGYLNNPYRSARILGASVPERYPSTRTSNAVALRAVQGLQLANDRAAARLDYRYFRDTWDIGAHAIEIGYERYYRGELWLFDGHYRYYTQSRAAFYSDNFDTEYNYMARDKELSTFVSRTLGGKASWRFLRHVPQMERASLNLAIDYVIFDYDDFTDVRTGAPYSFDAYVIQAYFSWRF